jgi:hypothetical protein
VIAVASTNKTSLITINDTLVRKNVKMWETHIAIYRTASELALYVIMAQTYYVNFEIVGLAELKLILRHRSAIITLVAWSDTSPTKDKVTQETGHVYMTVALSKHA